MCVFVCPPPRLLITSGVMWHDMDLILLVYSFYIAVVVSIISGCGFSIDVCHRNQLYKSYLAICFSSHLKQTHISNNDIASASVLKVGVMYVHGCTYVEVFKGRASFGYRYMSSNC